MYAPFVKDSDDMLSQLAQLQIFLTLLSSLALRAVPPSKIVGDMVTVILFLVPLIALALETPLLKELSFFKEQLGKRFRMAFPNLRPPLPKGLLPSDREYKTEQATDGASGGLPIDEADSPTRASTAMADVDADEPMHASNTKTDPRLNA